MKAGGRGFEPRPTEPESAVLPLNYPPTGEGPVHCAGPFSLRDYTSLIYQIQISIAPCCTMAGSTLR